MSPTILIIGAAALIAGIILVVGIINVRSDRNVVEERLGFYEQQSFQSFLDIENDSTLAPQEEKKTLLMRLDNAIASRPSSQKSRLALSRADLKITVAEYVALHFITTIGFFIVGYFVLFGQQLVMGVIAGFIGFFVPRIVVAQATSRRLINFENQLPDTLGLWVNGLRSGYSVLQSMEAISRDAPEPTTTEFKRVVQEVQIGIDMEDSFQHMLNRLESEDLDLVVTAVNIQREVGGNLAEILEVIAYTVRERIKLKGEIRVLTAQGRITGYVISGLPIVLALFLYVINPHYMGNLFENRLCGWPMLGIGLLMIGIGTALIQKIVDIQI